MIRSFCARLYAELETEITSRRDTLETGTGSVERDERLRGEIWGFRKTMDIVTELEAQARKAERNDDDML